MVKKVSKTFKHETVVQNNMKKSKFWIIWIKKIETVHFENQKGLSEIKKMYFDAMNVYLLSIVLKIVRILLMYNDQTLCLHWTRALWTTTRTWPTWMSLSYFYHFIFTLIFKYKIFPSIFYMIRLVTLQMEISCLLSMNALCWLKSIM